jgi:hypothetical protein
MANESLETTDEIYINCTLTLNDHTFPINLLPMHIGSFDIIAGMDWLDPNRAEVMCHEKAVRLKLPNGDQLIVYGNKPAEKLRIISCVKVRKYLQKKYYAFVAQVGDTKEKEKEVKDVAVVRDFPDVFPKDLPGVPPSRQVEFRIDLIPGAAPVAKSPYRLAPSEMQELSSQLQELLDK